MTNNEIKERYGIEPIMKEMWVWDEDKNDAKLAFVTLKDISLSYPYHCFDLDKEYCNYLNASETNPNDKEPEVGDKGYFWDDSFIKDGSYIFTKISKLSDNKTYKFVTPYGSYFQHFSHEKQPWMG